MSEDSNDLTPEQTADLVGLAMNPSEGEAFTLGGVERKRCFLRIDAEQALAGVLVQLIKKAPSLDLADMFIEGIGELREAAAIIIADTDDTDRFAAADWIANTRGISTSDLLELVLAQIALNRLGALLGKLLRLSGQFGALSLKPSLGTSAE